ncbi:putative pyruvate carboxyltransferase, aldolase-type TIM barrel, HMG-CoA lyase [Septoria linicola]|nr:putative pyruvate carboxyltransferase, aldolase-type TIM barrel, HMG-CoA lyase [Septoria linicola]
MALTPLRTLSARRLCTQSFTRSFSSSRQTLADHVRIVEVGPRDGLQNEQTSIPAETKIELVNRLAGTGLKTIEAGSFVHPKWVPQMAASDKVLSSILTKPPPGDVTYQWLLPNRKGLDNYFKVMNTSASAPDGYPTPPPSPGANDNGPALNTSSQDPNAMPSTTSGVDAMSSSTPGSQKHEVSIFMAATESFSQKNTNCSIQESLDRFAPLIASASKAGYPVRAYISVALGCPFEGVDVDPHRVAELAASLLELGADEISVADTTGMGTAPATKKLLQTLKEAGVQNEDIAMHFHDTFGQALINTMVSLEHGVRTFDSAVGGLGGCPYSPGATGNVATEDLVYCLHSLGLNTGLDLDELSRIGDWITERIGKTNGSSAGKATLARLAREGTK